MNGRRNMTVTLFASRLPGRLRLRHPALRRPQRNAAAVARLAGLEGTTLATGNAATGGLLLLYDHTRIAPAAMEAQAAAALGEILGLSPAPSPEPAPEKTPERMLRGGRGRPVSRAVNIGMLASMAATLLALAAGRRLHAAFGVAHLAFLAVHLAIHRKKLQRDLTLT